MLHSFTCFYEFLKDSKKVETLCKTECVCVQISCVLGNLNEMQIKKQRNKSRFSCCWYVWNITTNNFKKNWALMFFIVWCRRQLCRCFRKLYWRFCKETFTWQEIGSCEVGHRAGISCNSMSMLSTSTSPACMCRFWLRHIQQLSHWLHFERSVATKVKVEIIWTLSAALDGRGIASA